jgi:hypothetical protein
MLWRTPQERQRYLIYSGSLVIGMPLSAVGCMSFLSLLGGNGGTLSQSNWGVIVLACCVALPTAIVVVIALFDKRFGV